MINRIFTRGTCFVDENGRERIFNGVNIVDKNSCFLQKSEFKKTWSEKNLITLKNLGFNVIRLGFTWDAIEPEMGVYNEDYINVIAEAISLCEKHEIYFYLDCHQDLFTSKSPHGDGAPKWAVIDEGAKWNKPLAIWAEGYFYGKGVMNSFENFWLNKPIEGKGILDRYTDMWKYLAKRFGDSPALLGFDVLNEPYPGKDGSKVFTTIIESAIRLTSKDAGIEYKPLNISNHFKNGTKSEFVSLIAKLSTRFKSKKFRSAFFNRFDDENGFHEIVCEATPYIEKFDKEYYTPFLNKVTEGIREVTDNGIILMENSYFSNLGIPYSAEPVTVNGKREKNLAFAPHGYDIFVDSSFYNFSSNDRAASIFKEHKKSQKRLQTPVIVGEFGGMADGTKWLSHIDYIIDFFNSNKWSSTYWVYNENMFKSKQRYHFSRPYPQAVCGTISHFNYDRLGEMFSLSFECDKDYGDIKSIIFLHKKALKIYCDTKYTIEKLSKKTSLLLVDSPIGSHRVQVQFEE